jgi:hypothetical protein
MSGAGVPLPASICNACAVAASAERDRCDENETGKNHEAHEHHRDGFSSLFAIQAKVIVRSSIRVLDLDKLSELMLTEA